MSLRVLTFKNKNKVIFFYSVLKLVYFFLKDTIASLANDDCRSPNDVVKFKFGCKIFTCIYKVKNFKIVGIFNDFSCYKIIFVALIIKT